VIRCLLSDFLLAEGVAGGEADDVLPATSNAINAAQVGNVPHSRVITALLQARTGAYSMQGHNAGLTFTVRLGLLEVVSATAIAGGCGNLQTYNHTLSSAYSVHIE
jgi:hypothetical protein